MSAIGERIESICGYRDRLAGTDAERRLTNALAADLEEAGMRVAVEPTWVHPQWPLAHLLHCLLAIAGSMDSTTSPEAQKALDGILASASKVALDFTELDYISSAGLRVLLGAAKTLLASGGSLRIFGLNPSVREVFEISGFSTILAVYPTEAEALAG